MSRDFVDSGPLRIPDDVLVHRGYRFQDVDVPRARPWRWLQCCPDTQSAAGREDTDETPTCLWCVAERHQR